MPSTSFRSYSRPSADADEAGDDDAAAVLTDPGGTKRCKSDCAPSVLYQRHQEQAGSGGSGTVIFLLLTVPTLVIVLELPSPASR